MRYALKWDVRRDITSGKIETITLYMGRKFVELNPNSPGLQTSCVDGEVFVRIGSHRVADCLANHVGLWIEDFAAYIHHHEPTNGPLSSEERGFIENFLDRFLKDPNYVPAARGPYESGLHP